MNNLQNVHVHISNVYIAYIPIKYVLEHITTQGFPTNISVLFHINVKYGNIESVRENLHFILKRRQLHYFIDNYI